MPDSWTRNIIFMIRILSERSVQMQQLDIYLNFIDKSLLRYDKDILKILGLLDLADKDILTFNKKKKSYHKVNIRVQ